MTTSKLTIIKSHIFVKEWDATSILGSFYECTVSLQLLLLDILLRLHFNKCMKIVDICISVHIFKNDLEICKTVNNTSKHSERVLCLYLSVNTIRYTKLFFPVSYSKLSINTFFLSVH